VARIEVIKGGRGSVLYGDNAAGGVINIITKRGGETLDGEIGLGFGSFGTGSARASVAGTCNDLSFAVSGSALDSNGYRDNSDVEKRDLGLDLGYWVGSRARLNLSAGFHEDDARLPGALTQNNLDAGISRTVSLSPNDFSETRDRTSSSGRRFTCGRTAAWRSTCHTASGKDPLFSLSPGEISPERRNWKQLRFRLVWFFMNP
jgi:iron complex outermembrane receptor protein